MIDLATAKLAIQAAKAVYELWMKNQPEAGLALTDSSKVVLKSMQSDHTENGLFVNRGGMGTSSRRFVNPYNPEHTLTTTRRVVAELEAKGLIEPHHNKQGTEGIKLTHLGWILDPETGKADKVG